MNYETREFRVPLDATQRYRIVHSSTMTYPEEVNHSHNELRMTPTSEPGQSTLDSRLRVKPMTWSYTYLDHWGNQVMVAECATEHHFLEIEATSVVERYLTPPPVGSAGWDALAEPSVADQLSEYLMNTVRTEPGKAITKLASKSRTQGTPREAAEHFARVVSAELTYQTGVTGVQSTAQEAWEAGVGVCQDLAHITLGGLRGLDIPARYVSGYLAPSTDSPIGETSFGESHAWVEYWDGAWIGIDPTNAQAVGLDHIVLGRGRDYADIAPFRGMYQGPRVSSVDVSVSFTRIA